MRKIGFILCLGFFISILFSCKEEKQRQFEDPTKVQKSDETNPGVEYKPIMQKFTTEEMVERIIKDYPIKNKNLKKVITESVYDGELVKTFTYLAESTGGELIYAENSKVVISKILNILDQHLTANTDVVFVLDRTSSMMDDLEETKKNVEIIINKLGRLEHVRVSVTTYGDKNSDGKNWYRSLPLTNNFDMVKDFVKDIDLLDGGDYPESANDAIFKMIKELNWHLESNKLVIVLGDAPSHIKPFSSIEIEDVVELCKVKNILINFYPIILAMENIKKSNEKEESEDNYEITSFISKIKMNYIKDVCNIDLKFNNRFKLELFSNRGEKLKELFFFGNSYELDIRNLNNGSYVLRIVDEQNKQLDGQFFNIERKSVPH